VEDTDMIVNFAKQSYPQPCPTRYESERSVYFQPEMSL
jgi:hypothetical protein